jgi:YYY domain-containing protein
MNYDQFVNYVYGTLPVFVTRAVGRWVDPLLCGETALLTPGSCPAGTYTGYAGIHYVGRGLSALADLVALLGLILLARTLYGGRVSLLAGGLYAFAVLPIQHAHFFVVDSFATVFVVWSILLSVLSTRKPKLGFGILVAGLTTGLAVASKISVWPLAAIIGFTGVVRFDAGESPKFRLSNRRVLLLIASGTIAALAFRTAQPYAFTGPGFLGVKPNLQWISTIQDVRRLMSGLQDVPYGHQWTARTPVLFPLRNMIFWGMGLALGVTAWLGWVWIGLRLIKRIRMHTLRQPFSGRILIPWIWGIGFFLYQSTQWVKSMRYLLPVYPFFALFSAIFLVDLARLSFRRRSDSAARQVGAYVMRLLPGLVFLATALWAWAFLHIYLKPVTRVKASRWMYDNIPTAVTLDLATGDRLQVPIKPDTELSAAMSGVGGVIEASGAVWIESALVNKIDPNGIPGPREVEVVVNGQSATASLNFTDPGLQSLRVAFNPPVRVPDGGITNVEVSLVRGQPVILRTSVIANEHWDDPLPLRIDGKDPFWNWYQDLNSSPTGQMNNYDNDTEKKRQLLLDWLDEADFIALSSNRLYASIPRLPQRYPLTTAYYKALFNGDLGYELRAEFVSYPTLGSLQFSDQEIPFSLGEAEYSTEAPYSISFPPAEEAFSVYDHPTVLIFAKTPAYSPERAEAQLPPSLLADVRWMTPREATRERLFNGIGVDDQVDSLLLDPKLQIEQASGGTWSKLFDTGAIHNRIPALSVLLWWGALLLLGWMAFPWLYLLFPSLRNRGYGLAKVIGLLLWAYTSWLLASLHILPSVRLTLTALLFAGLVIGGFLIWLNHRRLLRFFRVKWREILRIELIFLGLYLAWVGVRYLNPDLWHPVSGGEKPMDFAYLNAVIKSTWFPPYDPWFASGRLNYYYFGFVIVGALIELLGIVPSIAYNLAVPSFFAMTGLGAYTVVSNLAGGDERRAVRAGIWGVLLLLIFGNLGEVQLIFNGLVDIGGVDFESLIPGYPDLVSALVGIWKVITKGHRFNFRPEWWYWDATRMIPFAEGEVGPINEFPAFTFLYADLHAHMMALPVTYVALSVALQWGLGASRSVSRGWKKFFPKPVGSLLFAMLVLGTLRATNTWDYPTYLLLMAFGSVLGVTPSLRLSKPNQSETSSLSEQTAVFASVWEWLGRLLVTLLLLFLGAELLFRPFVVNYTVSYTAFDLWKGTRTPLGIFLLMVGHLLYPLILGAWMDGKRWVTDLRISEHRSSLWRVVVISVAASLLGISVAVIFFRAPIGWTVVPLGLFAAFQVIASRNQRRRTLWWWTGSALALALMVELLVLRGDIGRMNTVFKFHYQIWTLLGVCAAVFVERIVHGWLERDQTTRVQEGALVVMALLLLGVGLYPALAVPAKTQDRWAAEAPLTLDGMAFMAYATQYEHGSDIPLWADYNVIRWLQENVEGTPVIMEGLGAREYLWGSRVSVYTGLPAVAAWRWHQVQQRGAMPPGTVEARMQDVRYFYNGATPAEAVKILHDYDISYVIVTPYERAYMIPEAEAKFADLVKSGFLDVAYQDSYSTIYTVVK